MLDQPDLDNVFRALADPGRRVMLERLTRGPATVTELAKPLDMSLTAVLQHVQVLEASGLIPVPEGRPDPGPAASTPPSSGRLRPGSHNGAPWSSSGWTASTNTSARTADPPDAALGRLSLDNTDDESRENR